MPLAESLQWWGEKRQIPIHNEIDKQQPRQHLHVSRLHTAYAFGIIWIMSLITLECCHEIAAIKSTAVKLTAVKSTSIKSTAANWLHNEAASTNDKEQNAFQTEFPSSTAHR